MARGQFEGAGEGLTGADEIAGRPPDFAQIEMVFGVVGLLRDGLFEESGRFEIAVLRTQRGGQGEEETGIFRLDGDGAFKRGDGGGVIL